MKIRDVVYGTVEINEPILLELIESPTVQRLKKINQHGLPPHLYYLPTPGFKRYDHCVGVMLLLRKLGASVEEQAAGLLHDASHLAFSHLADEVFDSGLEQDLQDSIHEDFLRMTEIPEIIQKHDLNFQRIVNYEHFPLLEQPAPALCADRVDYTLRELEEYADKEGVGMIVEALTTFNNRIVFKTKEAAQRFARGYLKCQVEHWGHADSTARYHLAATAFKEALKEGILTREDFYTDDETVLNKISKSSNPLIKKILSQLEKPILYTFEENNPDIENYQKFRWINPAYLEEGNVVTLIENDKEYATLVEKERAINKKGTRLKFL
ncbi:MAG: HD domain-containing protein [Candidatus Nanoarchaeia archaeon]